jgi:hypothetical protein
MDNKPIYIVDEIGAIVAAVDAVTFTSIGKHIDFMYGHFSEILSRLQQMTSSPDMKDRLGKFPLVALLMDFPEDIGAEAGVYCEVDLHLIIANITEPQLVAQQRYEKNFKPVLYPIYRELLKQIASPLQKSVFVEDSELIPHTKIDRVYWGREGLYGGGANAMNDFVDCIEIKNLKIKFYNKY